MTEEIQGGPYVIEVQDVERFHWETGEEDYDYPYEVSKEVTKYRYWEDAVKRMFGRPYLRRDGYATICEDENNVFRIEYDEGGTTEYVLHKWDGFEKCRKVEWVIEKGSEKWTVHSNDEMYSVLESYLGKGARIYWKDGWAGVFGYAEDKDDHSHYDILVKCNTKWLYGKEYLDKVEARERQDEDIDEPKPKRRKPAVNNE